MTIKIGDTIPASTFVEMTDDGLKKITSEALFKGCRVAMFSVPGAFTPTCSAQHLPGFVDKSDALKAKGINKIACVSVNDAFVMGAWGKASNVGDKVAMLADGNGDFAKAMGLEIDITAHGMGVRAGRYSMVVNDGVIEHLFIEAPGEFKVSSADHMLGNI